MPGPNRKRRSWIRADWFLRWFIITNKESQLRYELNALLKPTILGEVPQPDYLPTQHHSSFKLTLARFMMFVHPVDFDTDGGGHPLLGVLHRETRKQRPGHSQLFAVVIHWTRRWWVIITIPANARTGLILKGSARKFLTVFLLILHLLRISCSLCHSYGLKKFLPHAFYPSPSLWNANWTLSYSSVLLANTVRFAN